MDYCFETSSFNCFKAFDGIFIILFCDELKLYFCRVLDAGDLIIIITIKYYASRGTATQ